MASEPTANISRDCAALARREGHGHGHVQGVSKISSQKNATTTKNLPSPPDYIRTLANRPVGANNPGCCCTGLKTGWARTGCEHGSVKTKQAKAATRPLLTPVQTKIPSHPYASFGTKACPPPRQTTVHRRGCCGGSSAGGRLSGWGARLQCGSHEEEQGRSHCWHVSFITNNVVASTIFLASLSRERKEGSTIHKNNTMQCHVYVCRSYLRALYCDVSCHWRFWCDVGVAF